MSCEVPIETQHVVGDCVPAESRLHSDSSVVSHPSGPFEVREQSSESPGYRVRIRIDLKAVDFMPDELGRTAAIGGDDGFTRTPGFQQHDSERFVTAWHAYDV